jgi:hypothetical protein
MDKYIKFLIFGITFFAQAEAQQKQLSEKSIFLKYSNDLIEYNIGVLGVECKICAQEAINRISMIPWATKISFCWVNNDYRNSYAVLFSSVRNFCLQNLEKVFAGEKFSLGAIKGVFQGRFKRIEKKQWQFNLLNSSRKFEVICCNQDTLDWLEKRYKHLPKKTAFVAGVLNFQGKKAQIIIY